MIVDEEVEKRVCKQCDGLSMFCVENLSHFCPTCNIWLSHTCHPPGYKKHPDGMCDICFYRPEKPLQIIP